MVNEFITALQFLTRIRLVKEPRCDEASFGRSVGFFPLVGLVAGALLALVSLLTGGWLSATVRSTLLVSMAMFITGGLHCDGLMDTADGVLSGRSRERMLEIMKDSCAGSFGVVVMVLLVFWKWSLIHDMPESLLAPALISMMTFGRYAMVVAILRFPYARQNGMGKAFKTYAGPKSLWMASLTVVGLLVVLQFLFDTIAVIGAVISLLASILFSLALSTWLTRRLGGLSGDMYGAVTELSEVVVLTGFVASTYIR